MSIRTCRHLPRSVAMGVALGLASSLTGAATPTPGVYTDVAVEAWSNGMPVLDIGGRWRRGYDPRTGTQRAYESVRAEAGVRLDVGLGDRPAPLAVGLLVRADATAVLSGQAADIVYHYQSRRDPTQAGVFNADAQAQYWKGTGVAFHAPTLSWQGWSLDAGWDHMRLQRFRTTRTAGEVAFDGVDTYQYRVGLRDDSWRTRADFTQAPDDHGTGEAVSFRVSWKGAAAGTASAVPAWVNLRIDDAWSRLQWNGINGVTAQVDSQTTQRAPDGSIDYQPLVKGQYTRKTLRERIPVSAQLGVGWALPVGDASVRLQHRLGLWQRWVGWESPGAVRFLVEGEPVVRAVRLGARWQGLSLHLMTDRLDSTAHMRGGDLSWALDF